MCGKKYKDYKPCLEYKRVKDDLIEWTCFYCNKNYQNKFDENVKSDPHYPKKLCSLFH